jgi:hypothetical protein
MRPARALAIVAIATVVSFACAPGPREARKYRELRFVPLDAPASDAAREIASGRLTATPLQFLKATFDRYRASYLLVRGDDYLAYCRDLSLDPGANRDAAILFFLHDLLTCGASEDYSRSGFLGLPYLWHWVDPNPRHALKDAASGTLLVELPPPAGFSAYASLADIDRAPEAFLGDLFLDRREYLGEDGTTFPTFGWCSEREMAYAAIANSLGFVARVVEGNGHVWSEIGFDAAGADGSPRRVMIRSDATFDRLSWSSLEAADLKAWRMEASTATSSRWYNAKASSPPAFLHGSAISAKRAAWILASIDAAFRAGP